MQTPISAMPCRYHLRHGAPLPDLSWLRVKFVTNFTDVDDKIIRRANERGQNPVELANHYAQEYLRHLDDLNIMARMSTRASSQRWRRSSSDSGPYRQGYAYELDGDVYFRVTKDTDYGKLSGRRWRKLSQEPVSRKTP